MADIAVYTAEQEAGLADAIRASGRVAMAGVAYPDSPRPISPKLQQAVATNLGQMDLYYLKSVLVTTGVNKNDDYFDGVEMWLARATPEDKPFNYEHNQDDIIGHITDCRVVGVDGADIPSDTAVDKLPSKFHILTSAVLYRCCEAADRQTRIDRIIAELPKNKWFVSMEALFRGFDYVLLPQDGSVATARVVARNQETAFLTKHLRAYGGDGVFNDYRVGRVLRNITFAGKGLVSNPANPESVIFTQDDQPSEGALAQISQLPPEVVYKTDSRKADTNEEESNTVANENTAIEALQKQVAELVSENKGLKEQLTVAQAKDWEKQVAKLQAELDAVKAEAKVNADKATDLEAKAKETEVKLTEATEAKTKAEQALTKIESEKRFADRLAEVKAAYKVDGDEAKEMAENLSDLSDEAFSKHITKVKAKVSSLQLGESNVSNKPAPMAGEPTKVAVDGGPTGKAPPVAPATVTANAEDETAEGAAEALNAAKPNKDAAGAVAAEKAEAGVEELQADIMRYWGLKAEAAE